MSKFHFIKYEDNCWVRKIETIEQLVDYHTEVRTGQVAKAFAECIKPDSRAFHHSNELANMIDSIALSKECSLIEAADSVDKRVLMTQMEYLEKGRTIYINEKGGYNFGLDLKIIEEKSSNKSVFPPNEDKIPRYIKWPGGRHWYVKVGNTDVYVDDKMKWNTRKAAVRAYERWNKL